MKKSKKDSGRKSQIKTGTVIAHPKGFGFVSPDDGGADVYLPVFEMNTVLHGDRVKIDVTRKGKSEKLAGHVLEVIERANKRISGVVCAHGDKRYVQPLDKRISHDIDIDKTTPMRVKPGDVVEVNITQFPGRRQQRLCGEIINVFGEVDDANMPVTLALYKHQIPHVWPKAIDKVVKHAPGEVTNREINARVDLRSLNFVTIDGESARDFDDAVLVDKTATGFTLYVAIADVANYVRPGSVLDKLAYERGTSVYFPNQVVPMLPECYANGICSLNPAVDRLVMVCEIALDETGRRIDSRFYEAVINSKARLTYSQVWDFLSDSGSGNPDSGGFDQAIGKTLRQAYTLFQKLLTLRLQRGALELEVPETVVNINQDGEITGIEPTIRNNAHRLIEEFMLAANICAAELIDEKLGAGMFRIHERPDDERISDLRYFLSDFNLMLPGGDRPSSEDFVKVFDAETIKDEWRYIISTMMLRTQKQARYSDQVGIHFALNYPAYTHFTSPIRRYPDLIVHRLIKAIINKRKPEAKLMDHLAIAANHCSVTERRAEEAAREVIGYYKLKFLQSHVGECFNGVITGVSSFGFFVELNKVMTSGLVHVTSLGDDYYHFDPLKHQLIGERSAKVYKIGQKVAVQIARVDLEDKKMDLVISKTLPGGSRKPIKRQSRRKK